jgi:hypothetical protein
MIRRTFFTRTLAAAAALAARVRSAPAQSRTLPAAELRTLGAVAAAVLPERLGPKGATAVVNGFLHWLAEFKPGADLEHGYGFPRLRAAAQHPAARYAAQLAEIERAARKEGAAFAALPLERQRALLDDALRGAKIDTLPQRPAGLHVVADLMSFYFRGSDANDLCYEAAIERDQCRGLPGSGDRPRRLGARTD